MVSSYCACVVERISSCGSNIWPSKTGRSHHSGLVPFLWLFFLGVHDIQTDVEAKSVVVEADGSVSPELMLEKLLKVRDDVLRRHCLEFWELILSL